MSILDSNLKKQLQTYMEMVTQPFELVASLDDGAKSQELRELLEEISAMSEHISLRTDGDDARTPSFSLERPDGNLSLRFAAIPMGHEFSSLVLALLHAGGHPPRVDEGVAEQIRALDKELKFETYMSLSCQNCPDVVQALNLMAILNPKISHVTIDGALFQEEVDEREVMAVPTVFLNGEPFEQGRVTLQDILNKVDRNAGARAAQSLNDREPYEVLIIGGGPAGAASAIYAARKGIRTGMVADQIGGQLLETLGIENFISVKRTEGPELASALRAHIDEYDVDVLEGQQATQLIPAEDGGMHQVEFASGGRLRARSVVLATGARWRHINVPGEDAYRHKGVAYCPHCDAPLFKGKKVGVIGGGNSGVEAAIDLAGIAKEVTLLEYQEDLIADAVLQKKLRSLSNTTVITSAATTEITGDANRMTGLTYVDRATDTSHHLQLDGVFIQIGLVPNTGWLQDAIELTEHGEIVIDDHGKTSVDGIFAAGDVTTVPYKQIVIAMGAGSTAALSAFDYIIRQAVTDENVEG